MQMEKEIDLLELCKVLLKRWWVLVICMVVGGLLGLIVSSAVLPKEYEAYTTMYVKNYNVPTPEQESSIELGDLNTSKALASTYIAVLKSNAVMEEVAKKLTDKMGEEKLGAVFPLTDGKVSITAIQNSFTMNSVDDTEVMKITARTQDPEVSAELCNILAEVAPSFLTRVVGAGSVEIIDTASPNSAAVSPSVMRNAALGALVGLVLSSGIIILLSFLDDSIKGKEDLTQRFERPILGEVQRMSGGKGKRSKSAKGMLLTDPAMPFNVKESYKTIRTNILFSIGTLEKKVIALSSVDPGDGKSTTAANVAIAFAQTGSKVLLIDADMRKPVQYNLFHVKNTEGLSTLIAGMSAPEDSFRSSVAENLDLLPSGPIPPNPSELLASEQFGKLIDQAAKRYDYVIIDTPPINVVTDALVMREFISGVLLVVKHNKTKLADVTDCMRRLEFAKANMLGFVMNDIQQSGGIGYYRTKDGGYGDYYSAPARSEMDEERHAD